MQLLNFKKVGYIFCVRLFRQPVSSILLDKVRESA